MDEVVHNPLHALLLVWMVVEVDGYRWDTMSSILVADSTEKHLGVHELVDVHYAGLVQQGESRGCWPHVQTTFTC